MAKRCAIAVKRNGGSVCRSADAVSQCCDVCCRSCFCRWRWQQIRAEDWSSWLMIDPATETLGGELPGPNYAWKDRYVDAGGFAGLNPVRGRWIDAGGERCFLFSSDPADPDLGTQRAHVIFGGYDPEKPFPTITIEMELRLQHNKGSFQTPRVDFLLNNPSDRIYPLRLQLEHPAVAGLDPGSDPLLTLTTATTTVPSATFPIIFNRIAIPNGRHKLTLTIRFASEGWYELRAEIDGRSSVVNLPWLVSGVNPQVIPFCFYGFAMDGSYGHVWSGEADPATRAILLRSLKLSSDASPDGCPPVCDCEDPPLSNFIPSAMPGDQLGWGYENPSGYSRVEGSEIVFFKNQFNRSPGSWIFQAVPTLLLMFPRIDFAMTIQGSTDADNLTQVPGGNPADEFRNKIEVQTFFTQPIFEPIQWIVRRDNAARMEWNGQTVAVGNFQDPTRVRIIAEPKRWESAVASFNHPWRADYEEVASKIEFETAVEINGQRIPGTKLEVVEVQQRTLGYALSPLRCAPFYPFVIEQAFGLNLGVETEVLRIKNQVYGWADGRDQMPPPEPVGTL